MITISNKSIWPKGSPCRTDDVPTVRDIAAGLGRQSRFAGQTKKFYTVLCHTLAASDMVSRDDPVRPYLLLHDASEAIMSDCPTTWKPKDFKARELEIYEMVCRIAGLTWPVPGDIQWQVDAIDFACLQAEAHVLGHARAEEYWPTGSFSSLTKDAVNITEAYLETGCPMAYLDPDVAHPILARSLEQSRIKEW